ncbi:MAG: hypothetical protein NVSMB49_24990 [Ktedonobacteraceae bacterium]
MQSSTGLSKLPALVGSDGSLPIVAAKSIGLLQRVERTYTMSTEDNKTLIRRKQWLPNPESENDTS